MAAPASPRPCDRQLLEQVAATDQTLHLFWEQQAAANQALLADLLASDDEPAPPRC